MGIWRANRCNNSNWSMALLLYKMTECKMTLKMIFKCFSFFWKTKGGFLLLLLLFFFFRDAPIAYGGSQATGQNIELYLLAYATTTETQNPSYTCNLHHSSQQYRIFNPLSRARDWTHVLMDTSQIHFGWATVGTPGKLRFCLLPQHAKMNGFSRFLDGRFGMISFQIRALWNTWNSLGGAQQDPQRTEQSSSSPAEIEGPGGNSGDFKDAGNRQGSNMTSAEKTHR